MPRKNPDLTILIRKKNSRKFNKIEIFNGKNENIKMKVDNSWFKNKRSFNINKIGNLILNTIKNKFL